MIKSCVIHATSDYARSRNGSVVSSGTRIVLMWAAFINFALVGLPSELCEQSLRLKWIRPQWSWMEDLRACAKKDLCNQGPRRGRGWGVGRAGRSHFLNKIKWNKLRNTHFLIKGIFDEIRILDWRTSPRHPNSWLVLFDPILQDLNCGTIYL